MKADRIEKTYGRWAVVLGASEGIGYAIAEKLASAGLSLVLAARRSRPLEAAADSIRKKYSVEVDTLILDLALPDPWPAIEKAIGDRDAGLIVYNAAASPIGPFLDMNLDAARRTVAVNIASPMDVVHGAGNRFRKRYAETGSRGGIILISSLSGLGGTPHVAAYAASKAWNIIFAEGTGEEARREGVDILACIAGATDTPGFRDSTGERGPGAPVSAAGAVAATALGSLGRRTSVVSGFLNKIVGTVMYGRFPRGLSTKILGHATSALRHRDDAGL